MKDISGRLLSKSMRYWAADQRVLALGPRIRALRCSATSQGGGGGRGESCIPRMLQAGPEGFGSRFHSISPSWCEPCQQKAALLQLRAQLVRERKAAKGAWRRAGGAFDGSIFGACLKETP